MAFDILVVGGANFDYLIKGKTLPRAGETLVGDTLHEAPGGKGANQAVAASRLGARVAFLGKVGADDRGRAMLAALEGERVDTSPSLVDDEASTGVALIMVDERGQKMIMTAPGANLELTAADIERRFETARVVLTQLEAGADTAAAIARQGREAGALVVLDAGPAAALPDEVLRNIDVVRCNAGEAHALTGIEVTGVDSARKAAQELRRRGVGAACISTKGGDLLVFEVDEVWLPHQHIKVIDTTGAGDAFAAGIAVGLAEGKSLTDAAWLGCVASALKTTRVGAQAGLPRRSEVDAMLQTIKRD